MGACLSAETGPSTRPAEARTVLPTHAEPVNTPNPLHSARGHQVVNDEELPASRLYGDLTSAASLDGPRVQMLYGGAGPRSSTGQAQTLLETQPVSQGVVSSASGGPSGPSTSSQGHLMIQHLLEQANKISEQYKMAQHAGASATAAAIADANAAAELQKQLAQHATRGMIAAPVTNPDHYNSGAAVGSANNGMSRLKSGLGVPPSLPCIKEGTPANDPNTVSTLPVISTTTNLTNASRGTSQGQSSLAGPSSRVSSHTHAMTSYLSGLNSQQSGQFTRSSTKTDEPRTADHITRIVLPYNTCDEPQPTANQEQLKQSVSNVSSMLTVAENTITVSGTGYATGGWPSALDVNGPESLVGLPSRGYLPRGPTHAAAAAAAGVGTGPSTSRGAAGGGPSTMRNTTQLRALLQSVEQTGYMPGGLSGPPVQVLGAASAMHLGRHGGGSRPPSYGGGSHPASYGTAPFALAESVLPGSGSLAANIYQFGRLPPLYVVASQSGSLSKATNSMLSHRSVGSQTSPTHHGSQVGSQHLSSSQPPSGVSQPKSHVSGVATTSAEDALPPAARARVLTSGTAEVVPTPPSTPPQSPPPSLLAHGRTLDVN